MSDILTTTKNLLRDRLISALADAIACGELKNAEIPSFDISFPADRSHGDLSTNLALVSARAFGRSPRDIASFTLKHLNRDELPLGDPEIAGAGFINFFFTKEFYARAVADILADGEAYGRTNYGRGERLNVEFVSANPTGPMHIGNARGGALGDCLASVMRAAGYDVTTEFYVNDAGNQIAKFGISLEARYLQHFHGESVPFPEDGYHGQDITDHAEKYISLHGDNLLGLEPEERRRILVDYALPLNVSDLKKNLLRYRIDYDVWFFESELHKSGAVADAIELLTKNGHTFEKDGALWYRPSVKEGEEPPKDEVLIRGNGIPTYYATDIAYHYNKLVTRGFDKAVLIWGADHHGHVARLKNAVGALGIDENKVEVILMQLVRLVRDGEQVRLSKRTGKTIALADLLDEVPLDAARFFFNLREPQSHLDFDLELAAKASSENPVYYVQYAYARICSILRALADDGVSTDCTGDYTLAETADEKELISALSRLPSLIAESAEKYDPAIITRYCIDVATLFHRFYTNCRVKDCGDGLRDCRIGLCRAVRQTLGNCLSLLKITAPESM